MTAATRERARRAKWESVHVVRGDAERLPVARETFDAAYAAMSFSTVPAPTAAAAAVRRALVPGAGSSSSTRNRSSGRRCAS